MDGSVVVRYGMMGNVATFVSKNETTRRGDPVIVRTDRGVEWGEVIKDANMVRETDTEPCAGEVLRKATESDYMRQQKIDEELAPEEMQFCEDMIRQHNLPMRLVAAEHMFGGNKVIFYFLAEGRVDFRMLVKDLAKKYQTRIEMRQIGVRDEARLLADYEHCGCRLCCKTFIKNLEPVTMKMAKNQKATLDPTKISGRCGRLMCCLRFEDKTYEQLKLRLPKRGVEVETPEGTGTVVDYDIIQQLVFVELGDGKRQKFKIDDVKRLPSKKRPERPDQPEPSDRPDRPPRSERGDRQGRQGQEPRCPRQDDEAPCPHPCQAGGEPETEAASAAEAESAPSLQPQPEPGREPRPAPGLEQSDVPVESGPVAEGPSEPSPPEQESES